LWDEYRSHCATLGRAVSVTLPGGATLRGTATAIDADGRLVVATGTGEERLAAGDVLHVRPDDDHGDPPVQGRATVAPDH
jgi:BirA family biotin operon repressor/biotin-[acetyl-CoA-carboxylase] ligase